MEHFPQHVEQSNMKFNSWDRIIARQGFHKFKSVFESFLWSHFTLEALPFDIYILILYLLLYQKLDLCDEYKIHEP